MNEQSPYRHLNDSYRTLWGTFNAPIKFTSSAVMITLHLVTIYGYIMFPYRRSPGTFLFGALLVLFSGFGITGGIHRYYTHRSFKANLALRIVLLVAFTSAGEYKIYNWVRMHRTHHKYSDTDSDPHNINRGFFFAHCGWLMIDKYPQVIENGRKIDCSDVYEDRLAKFIDDHYIYCALFLAYILPGFLVWYLFEETASMVALCAVMRHVTVLNISWLVNSAAHIYGTRPYDKDHKAVQSKWVSMLAIGEGWHNYHHTFPYDYRAAELGIRPNFTTALIDMFGRWGWASDFKTTKPETVAKCVERKGDGSWRK